MSATYESNPNPMERGLPKWPQMLVFGKPVSADQAKEIIRRTDSFFTWPDLMGNDLAYAKSIMDRLQIPSREMPDDQAQEAWRRDWGFVGTNYVMNDWIACSFIGGPHGWCHPDGSMGYWDNVGKWPSPEEIRDDWETLAQAFPFINLTVVLMDRESSEEGKKPVCGFEVAGGAVVPFDPLDPEHVWRFPAPEMPAEVSFEKTPMFDLKNERGIPESWIDEWAARIPRLADGERVEMFVDGIGETWATYDAASGQLCAEGKAENKIGTPVQWAFYPVGCNGFLDLEKP